MTKEEKIEVLDNMLICYVDRTNLTNKQIEESEEFVEELREAITVTHCCTEVCSCGGDRRVALDCTMKPCKHPYYFKE